jgi:hypothetical protein
VEHQRRDEAGDEGLHKRHDALIHDETLPSVSNNLWKESERN